MTNTIYRYLGYGTTDNTGTAKLEYDADGEPLEHSYTGMGIGEVDVVASLDNEMSESSIVSETYSIIDGTFFDKGLDGTGQHNDNWSNPNNRMIITRGTDGTELTSNADWAQIFAISQSTYFECDFCIEFDVLSFSDTPTIRFKNSSDTSAVFYINATGHYKIEWKSDSITITLDGTPQTHYLSSLIGSDVSFSFEHSNTTDVLKYKNFVVYPI